MRCFFQKWKPLTTRPISEPYQGPATAWAQSLRGLSSTMGPLRPYCAMNSLELCSPEQSLDPPLCNWRRAWRWRSMVKLLLAFPQLWGEVRFLTPAYDCNCFDDFAVPVWRTQTRFSTPSRFRRRMPVLCISARKTRPRWRRRRLTRLPLKFDDTSEDKRPTVSGLRPLKPSA